MRLLQKRSFHIFLVIFFGLIAYSSTLHVPFQFDDKLDIVENPIIKDIQNFIYDIDWHNYNPRRFIGYLSFALNYRIGGLNVVGYHIINVFIHLSNALLVFFLVLLTFETPYLRNQRLSGNEQSSISDFRQSVGLIALFSALLFVSHPLQTQAVTYIVQRFTSLATLFFLLSLLMYVKGRLASLKQKTKRFSSQLPLFFYFASFSCAVLAMKTKEITFVLPIIIALYDFAFFKTSLKKRCLFLLPFFITLAIIPLSLLYDKPLGELLSVVNDHTRAHTDMSRLDYFFTQMRVITTYIRLIFIPVNQNLDYDYPIYKSMFTPSVFLSFSFLLLLAGLAIYLLYISKKRNSPLYGIIGFGILWFLTTLSVESSVIPIGDVIFEHRVYLPSTGAFIAITTGAFIIARRLRAERIVVSIFLFLIMVLSGATYARNNIWKDEISLWEDTVEKSPNKARPHNNLGEVYYKMGRIDDSLREFKTALRINPYYAEPIFNIGTVYAKQGRMDEAKREFQNAIALRPDYLKAHYSLGNILVSQGRFEAGIGEIKAALKLNPDYSQTYNSLGAVYYKQGRLPEALNEYLTALRIDPKNAQTHFNLGLLFFKEHKFAEAIREYQIAVRLAPENAEAHNNLGAAYLALGRKADARKRFETVLKLNPGYTNARLNLEAIDRMTKSEERGTVKKK